MTPTPVTGATRTEPVTLSREKGLEIAEAIAKETNWKVKHVDKERFHLFAERPARVMGGGNIDRWQLEVYFHESAATGKDVVSVRAIPPAGAVQDPLKIVDEFLEAFLARAK